MLADRTRLLRRVLATLAVGFLFLAVSPAAEAGTTDILVVGGDGVIPNAVVEHLQSCTGGDIIRLAGPTRYATAATVSQHGFASADVVYLAVGTNYPDALTAGPVAAGRAAPILLVRSTSIPTETTAELDRLGPREIVILGGTGAVSASVQTALTAAYPAAAVERIGGADRFDTAALVSESYFAPGVTTAYVATGSNFPDALAGGMLAAQAPGPVLLTDKDALPQATKDELARLDPDEIVVLGGSGVVSDVVLTALESLTAGTVRRIPGSNRYATAAAIGAEAYPGASSAVYLATGLDFPDALATTPAASGGPLLLVTDDAIPASTANALEALTGQPCEQFDEPVGSVLAIGDSVMAGASKKFAPVPNLESEIPDLTVDATVSRQFFQAKSVVAALASADPPANIVIHLGTNGPPTSSQFADLMAVAGDTWMLFLTVKLDKSWQSATNSVIRANVPLYANAALVDWWALADPHPEWFSSDVKCGCHLWKSSARNAYIDLIASALDG